ncbi:E3 ubiquitin-protein ligase TRIM62-like [Scyliorhinus torazame]|uniref:E3 ubiquitin-protein ligase TRIM62-like n=1 Tax=Scyliorhinus torazame TaxID=75743 RepID=UPI003B5CAD64
MDSLDEELVCVICRDILVDPVTLPCGHNFCNNCVVQLKHWARNAEPGTDDEDDDNATPTSPSLAVPCYTCPLCHSSCPVSLELKRNVVLHNIIERHWQTGQAGASSLSCDLCKGVQRAPADKSCVNCGESFCALHLMPHQENPTFRDHVLVKPTTNISRLCKQHGKELELYCQTDQCPLCAYCMLPTETSHHHHQVIKLTDAASIIRDECKRELAKVDKDLAAVDNGLCDLEETASAQKDKLKKQEQAHLDFFRKVQLFLDIEERAWRKRYSVTCAQVNLMVDRKAAKLKQSQAILRQAKGTLQIAFGMENPMLLLQVLSSVRSTKIKEQDLGLKELQEVTNHLKNIVPEPHFTKKRNIPCILTALGELFSNQVIQLDTSNAHAQLEISREGITVGAVEGKHNEVCSAERFSTSFNVLAKKGYITGLHYWEVSVKNIPSWAVGVAYQSIPRVPPGSRLGTEENSWAFSCSKGGLCCAQHNTEVMYFRYEKQLENIGIYLDCDSGILAFCDADSVQCLYTFYCTLNAPVFPAFCPKFNENEEFSMVPMVIHSGIID